MTLLTLRRVLKEPLAYQIIYRRGSPSIGGYRFSQVPLQSYITPMIRSLWKRKVWPWVWSRRRLAVACTLVQLPHGNDLRTPSRNSCRPKTNQITAILKSFVMETILSPRSQKTRNQQQQNRKQQNSYETDRTNSHTIAAMAAIMALSISSQAWQGMTISKLHVNGRNLQNTSGQNVLLHGYMQPAGSYFNGGSGVIFTDPTDYNASDVAGELTYFKNVAEKMTHTGALFGKSHGEYCSFVRYVDGNAGWVNNGGLSDSAKFNRWISQRAGALCPILPVRGTLCGYLRRTSPGQFPVVTPRTT